MLHQEGQLGGPSRGSHAAAFFEWPFYHTRSRNSAAPGTGSWEFSELKGLRETDWLTDSQETDVYIRMPLNAKIDTDDLPLWCPESSHFPTRVPPFLKLECQEASRSPGTAS